MIERDARYPIGRFEPPADVTRQQRTQWIERIEALPRELRGSVSELPTDRLDRPYRPGGWTVRQVVHHLPDSHMNAYLRFKLALTEELPTIKPYHEERWSALVDGRTGDVEPSLALLEALHARWSLLLRSMDEADFARGYRHPEQDRVVRLEEALALYAWHGSHHRAHVESVGRGGYPPD